MRFYTQALWRGQTGPIVGFWDIPGWFFLLLDLIVRSWVMSHLPTLSLAMNLHVGAEIYSQWEGGSQALGISTTRDVPSTTWLVDETWKNGDSPDWRSSSNWLGTASNINLYEFSPLDISGVFPAATRLWTWRLKARRKPWTCSSVFRKVDPNISKGRFGGSKIYLNFRF